MDEKYIPALLRYRDHHIETGGFLRAVLENDCENAVFRADQFGLQALPSILHGIKQLLPYGSYGSPEAVKNWLAQRKVKEEASDG